MLTVHHLAFSRSTRVIWLLEELGLEYRIVRYERNENFRAPPALAKVHPLGKAPVIQDGERTLAESSVILRYIDERYGGGAFSPPPGSDDWFVHEEWLQYVESTAAFPIMVTRIGALTGGLSDRLARFIAPVLGKTLDNIAGQVADRTYLMGDRPMLADIQMAYPLELADRAGMLGDHAPITRYLGRLKARPAFAKAIAIGGPMLPASA